jgi:hypothetical protein
VQHAAGVAQARDTRAVEQVSVDTRNLRCDVGSQTEGAPRKLVYELECLKVEIVAGSSEERVHILEQRRHHELVAVKREEIKHLAAQALDSRSFRRENVLDVLGQ